MGPESMAGVTIGEETQGTRKTAGKKVTRQGNRNWAEVAATQWLRALVLLENQSSDPGTHI